MTLDPTTASIVAQNTEREQLRAENQRLREELAKAVAARDAEVERVRDASFVAGYDQAVEEIRARFAKSGDHGIVHVIATTWGKRSS